MDSNHLPHEHDLTFKLLFEDPKDILFLVRDIIGYSWAKDIEEGSIELADKEFVDEELRQNRADVIAKAKLRDREVYFYILIENQSTVDSAIAERLLKYMILLWARKIKEGAKKLPAIIPIVTYNGLERDWDVPQEIINAFDIFKDDIFKYALVNISRLATTELLDKQEEVLSPIVFYLEQVRDDPEELVERLKRIESKLGRLSQTNLERFLIWAGKVIRPKLTKEGQREYDQLAERVKRGGGVKMGEYISNVSRLLEESQNRKFYEGIQQGIQQGILRGKIEVAEKLIQKGFSDEEVAEFTGLDVEKVKELREGMLN